jgi:hypothetical protein
MHSCYKTLYSKNVDIYGSGFVILIFSLDIYYEFSYLIQVNVVKKKTTLSKC